MDNLFFIQLPNHPLGLKPILEHLNSLVSILEIMVNRINSSNKVLNLLPQSSLMIPLKKGVIPELQLLKI
uniref:Putative ovule protein n=1 Tax=Solanum chacoense TaxID=4108 RepID=A0A0V0GWZ1_SOLCH